MPIYLKQTYRFSCFNKIDKARNTTGTIRKHKSQIKRLVRDLNVNYNLIRWVDLLVQHEQANKIELNNKSHKKNML